MAERRRRTAHVSRLLHLLRAYGLIAKIPHSHRYRVTFKGPGGHSFGAFGMANPMGAMGRAIAKIQELQVPKQPRTTFNVGRIGGGTSVNSIPFEGWMELDMRSSDPASLAAVDANIMKAIDAAVVEENTRWGKPGVITADALAAVKRAVTDTKRIFSICFSERLITPASEVAGKLVADGAIGRVIQTVGLGPHRFNRAIRPAWFFDPAQGGTSIPDRRHREPLFGKDLSHQGPRSLVAVNNEDLTLYRVHWLPCTK